MNGKPHTHKPSLEREHPHMMEKGDWIIYYGDTKAKVCGSQNHPPTQEQIDIALAKAIHRHDENSRKAQNVVDVSQYVSTFMSEGPASNWPSEVILLPAKRKSWWKRIFS